MCAEISHTIDPSAKIAYVETGPCPNVALDGNAQAITNQINVTDVALKPATRLNSVYIMLMAD